MFAYYKCNFSKWAYSIHGCTIVPVYLNPGLTVMWNSLPEIKAHVTKGNTQEFLREQINLLADIIEFVVSEERTLSYFMDGVQGGLFKNMHFPTNSKVKGQMVWHVFQLCLIHHCSHWHYFLAILSLELATEMYDDSHMYGLCRLFWATPLPVLSIRTKWVWFF